MEQAAEELLTIVQSDNTWILDTLGISPMLDKTLAIILAKGIKNGDISEFLIEYKRRIQNRQEIANNLLVKQASLI